MFVYISIFFIKILEDSLATLRLIMVSNGRKYVGAFLQLIVTVIWILLTGWVLTDFMKDIYKIVAFALGAFAGSYFGSFLEERIALGTICFFVKNDDYYVLKNKLNGLIISFIDMKNGIILITSKRRFKNKVLSILRYNCSFIICGKVKVFS